MFFGLGGCVHDSQHQFHSALRTQENSKEFKKTPESFLKSIMLGKLKMDIEHFQNGKDGGASNPEDPSNIVLEILNMGLISSNNERKYLGNLE